jgi:hypothetical protein
VNVEKVASKDSPTNGPGDEAHAPARRRRAQPDGAPRWFWSF